MYKFWMPSIPGSNIRRLGRLLFILRGYFKEIRKCIGRYPTKDIVYGIRHGFAADRIYIYTRAGISSGEYLNDFQRQFTRFINPKPVRELLEDKLLFERLVGRFARVPVNYLYADRGRLVVLNDEWTKLIGSKNSEATHRFIMKRARGGGGVNVRRVQLRQETMHFSDASMSIDEFYKYFKNSDEYILCEFIEQSVFFHKIYPETTNTIRIVCMRDIKGEAFIASSVLRLGTQRSDVVDNFGRGGLSVNISPSSGVLGEAREHDETAPRKPKAYEFHPDTGTKIAGETLPGWTYAREEALVLMRQLPFINYVGWDVVLTETGPVFLEGNNYTGVRLAQIHSPLLRDSRVRDFYQRFGIVERGGTFGATSPSISPRSGGP